ncbi:small secreted protein [Alternaria alternata]|nr:small secreted protein [Alternaria alternata]
MMMFSQYSVATVFMLVTAITATLDPATSNTNGSYPSAPSCSPIKTSKAIQAAECSHNTRTSKQTFAVFTQDHQYDGNHGWPYGTCEAYNCAPGSAMKAKAGTWTFFWDAAGVKGEESGDGAGCIKSPKDSTCGCENSDGTFVYKGTNCK